MGHRYVGGLVMSALAVAVIALLIPGIYGVLVSVERREARGFVGYQEDPFDPNGIIFPRCASIYRNVKLIDQLIVANTALMGVIIFFGLLSMMVKARQAWLPVFVNVLTMITSIVLIAVTIERALFIFWHYERCLEEPSKIPPNWTIPTRMTADMMLPVITAKSPLLSEETFKSLMAVLEEEENQKAESGSEDSPANNNNEEWEARSSSLWSIQNSFQLPMAMLQAFIMPPSSSFSSCSLTSATSSEAFRRRTAADVRQMENRSSSRSHNDGGEFDSCRHDAMKPAEEDNETSSALSTTLQTAAATTTLTAGPRIKVPTIPQIIPTKVPANIPTIPGPESFLNRYFFEEYLLPGVRKWYDSLTMEQRIAFQHDLLAGFIGEVAVGDFEIREGAEYLIIGLALVIINAIVVFVVFPFYIFNWCNWCADEKDRSEKKRKGADGGDEEGSALERTPLTAQEAAAASRNGRDRDADGDGLRAFDHIGIGADEANVGHARPSQHAPSSSPSAIAVVLPARGQPLVNLLLLIRFGSAFQRQLTKFPP